MVGYRAEGTMSQKIHTRRDTSKEQLRKSLPAAVSGHTSRWVRIEVAHCPIDICTSSVLLDLDSTVIVHRGIYIRSVSKIEVEHVVCLSWSGIPCHLHCYSTSTVSLIN